jgi:hypothetical protein
MFQAPKRSRTNPTHHSALRNSEPGLIVLDLGCTGISVTRTKINR